MLALALIIEAVDVVDDLTLEVEHLEGLAVVGTTQGEELFEEADDVVALGVHRHLRGAGAIVKWWKTFVLTMKETCGALVVVERTSMADVPLVLTSLAG